MRSIRHLTPRYIVNRTIEKLYRRTHPGIAWLTPDANDILDSCLCKEDRGIEFGSGNSTVWFAKRVAFLDSVEHQANWYEKIAQMLDEARLDNVRYHLHARDADDNPDASGYVRIADSFALGSLDFALVDGIYRAHCVRAVIDKLKPGGLLIIDNVNLYLPCESMAPNSVPVDGKPVTPVWQEVYDVIHLWRTIWTSNGVSDTAIFIKPCTE
ncbi:MAG: class I SAM-dependent methyltransferase [Anaerolineaceae bacterium]|jgi:SAM-dependent methyltransferase|nr:class I SAM-dependent methyltransferase [Anaerolineaceae bacterium]